MADATEPYCLIGTHNYRVAEADNLIVLGHQHQMALSQMAAEIKRLRSVMLRAMQELGDETPLAALATLALEREP